MIKNFFITLYINFIVWKNGKSLEKELEAEMKVYDSFKNSYHYSEKEVERKYKEGLSRVKSKISAAATTKSKSGYEAALQELNELIGLAVDESIHQKAMRKILERMYIHKGADIKSEKDKVAMIDSRIEHYMELRTHKDKRQLNRKLRQATDPEVKKSLQEEWDNKYGKKENR